MARIYNIKLTKEVAKAAVKAFRDANPMIKSFWYALDEAAIACMKSDPGQQFQVRNGIWFGRNDKVLIMQLPSGRRLYYWYPRLGTTELQWEDDDTGEIKTSTKECVIYYA